MVVQSAWTGPPAPARRLALSGTPAQPRFSPLQEKTSGMEVRRTLDVRFRHVQLLMFIVVVIRSDSFCHVSYSKKCFFSVTLSFQYFQCKREKKKLSKFK